MNTLDVAIARTSGRLTIQTSDWTATVVTRHSTYSQFAKTRVYGAISAFAADENELVDKNAARGVSPYGDDDFDSQEARDAHMKEYRKLLRAATSRARAALVPALTTVIEALDQVNVKIERFSVKAGCSCTCSPGFVLDRRLTLDGKAVDVWFDAPAAE